MTLFHSLSLSFESLSNASEETYLKAEVGMKTAARQRAKLSTSSGEVGKWKSEVRETGTAWV
jgi:hypothetical protein